MRERLLAYLFGQLDDAERREVEDAIARDPRLQAELECLRKCLDGEGDAGDCDARESTEERTASEDSSEQPATSCAGADDSDSCHSQNDDEASAADGLAARTCQRVAETTWTAGSLMSPECAAKERGESTTVVRFADAIVAVGVALAAAALLLPAMQQSRHTARRAACQNNLRYVGAAMLQYANLHNGQTPRVPATGKDAAGGIVAVQLADSGIVDRESLASVLVCPSSPLAARLQTHGIQVRIPTREELLASEGKRLALLRRMMGGSYAYRIGYMDRGRYCMVRIDQSGRSPLMADAPSLNRVDFQSNNHDGCGQNVLFDDGHVEYCGESAALKCGDKLFLNRRDYRAAGVDVNDAVLVPSDAGPAIEIVTE